VIRIAKTGKRLTDSYAAIPDNGAELSIKRFMTLPSTNITLRQTGIVRIEIAAIVMLLVALATILITYSPPPEIAQAGEPSWRPPSVRSDPLAQVIPQPQLRAVSVTEPDMPWKNGAR